MKYTQANQKRVSQLNGWCRNIIGKVQKALKKYFTIDVQLIGSGEKRLVSQDENGNFDLDYNLFLQKNKKKIDFNKTNIKDIFKNAFSDAFKNEKNECTEIKDSTSVLQIKTDFNGKFFKFDVAILHRNKEGNYCKLVKDGDSYIWNEVPDTENINERYLKIKKIGKYNEFKEIYFKKKNDDENQKKGVKSFSLFLETLNEMEQKYGK